MDIDNILFMLETRLEVAKKLGNTTEESFLYALWEMAQENKEKQKNKTE